jgi:integrase
LGPQGAYASGTSPVARGRPAVSTGTHRRSRLVERSRATRAAAERALKEALRDRSRVGPDAEIGPETRVKQVAESWWADFESRGVSPGTLRLYRGRLDNHVLPGLGHLRIQELTVGRIHRHLSVLAENHGPGTARTTRAILSGICSFAAQRDALERNPVRDAGPARSDAPKRLPRSLTIEQARQLRALLSYDDEAVHRDFPDFVGFILATGCRIGEALALTWDAIDLEAGTVEIRGTKTAAGKHSGPRRHLVMAAGDACGWLVVGQFESSRPVTEPRSDPDR